MIPLKPYLIRAIYDWAIDNDFTPHILVDVSAQGVRVPMGFVRDGRITLNVHANAVRHLELTNERVSFSARFSGTSFSVEVPVNAVLAIFARENGRGVVFQDEPGDETDPPPTSDPTKGGPLAGEPRPRKGPILKIVK